MGIGYLALALVLALTLNAQARWLRVAGTLLAAAGLFMMVYSIILADLDGTFAAIPASAPLIVRITPFILNTQAVIATVAMLFLLWSAWLQTRRPVHELLPLRNDEARFGVVSRGFHWAMGIMMLCLVPIGLFMAVLPESAPERSDFVAAHQSLGITVFVLVIGRIGWLMVSPPPVPLAVAGTWEHRLARLVHIGLYGALLAFPLSGYLLPQGGSADFYGWRIATPDWPAAAGAARLIHAWVLPLLFYATLALHLLAVLKRHFSDGDRQAVRRMLR
ncbi:MAG: cytochrome b [Erythrobacter sp.]|jgi:cytochrome b561|nr:cytochrome b [Erythrobacter sp.]